MVEIEVAVELDLAPAANGPVVKIAVTMVKEENWSPDEAEVKLVNRIR